jgi:hypothetical protein
MKTIIQKKRQCTLFLKKNKNNLILIKSLFDINNIKYTVLDNLLIVQLWVFQPGYDTVKKLLDDNYMVYSRLINDDEKILNYSLSGRK